MGPTTTATHDPSGRFAATFPALRTRKEAY
jgi:hypothetical protein